MKQLARIVPLIGVLCGSLILHADTASVPAPAKPLTPSERAAKVAVLRAQIVADGQKVILLREQARKSNDVIKLNCVNDKQIQVKAEMNIADAANPSDGESGFTQLVETSAAIQHLREAAEGCVGTPELAKEELGDLVTEPDIVDDPTQTNPFAGGELEPPMSASK